MSNVITFPNKLTLITAAVKKGSLIWNTQNFVEFCVQTQKNEKRPSLDTAKRILKSPGIQASSSFAKI